jgi:glycosyltransferase involved in cell wall biosynthesis
VRVLAVGRLVPKKGFDVLLRACALLVRDGLDLEVEIVGEPGEQAGELEREASALRLSERVRFRGPLGQSGLFAAYRASTVLCVPSRILADGDRDGIPNVIAEAMACGLPVVATRVSGIPELVRDEVNGVLVEPDDERALAAAVLRVSRDHDLARRLGESGRATVAAQFDGDVLVRELAELFKRSAA